MFPGSGHKMIPRENRQYRLHRGEEGEEFIGRDIRAPNSESLV